MADERGENVTGWPPEMLTFHGTHDGTDRIYLSISAEGRLTLGPDITWDEAAQHLLASLERVLRRKIVSVGRATLKEDALSQAKAELAYLWEEARAHQGHRGGSDLDEAQTMVDSARDVVLAALEKRLTRKAED